MNTIQTFVQFMAMIMHKISVKETWTPETGWTWNVYTYKEDELNDMLAFLRDLDARNVTYVHTVEEE